MDAKTDSQDAGHSAVDAEMMQRCIGLSATATQHGELPFASLVCRGHDILVETTNQVVRDGDITRHAELIAISEAQKILKRKDLGDCTLYTTVEPCAMCSYAIREARISRIVFSIRSPVMGGMSKWNVLRDAEISRQLPEVFGSVPEVIAGLSRQEAEKVWSRWNPFFWSAMKFRGYLGGDVHEHLPAVRERRSLLRRLFSLHSRN